METRTAGGNVASGQASFRRAPRFALATLLGGVLFVACAAGCNQADVPPPGGAQAATAPAPVTAESDYLVVAPRAYGAALEPLVALRRRQGHQPAVVAVEDVYARRSHGTPSADALAQEVAERAATPGSALHFVLLAGDPVAGPVVVPSFEPRAAYVSDDLRDAAPTFRSDQPYALFDRPGERPLAVGRIPARSADELAAVVAKIVGYEAREAGGPWQRRVLMYGGPANFGAMVDSIIEGKAMTLLDQRLPYDYDLGLFFAKPSSPYAYRFDRLGDKLVEDLDGGALVAVYAGHGARTSFDTVGYRGASYRIGSRDDLAGLDIAAGKPLFVSLTCLTGAFGLPHGERSLAETMFLNPRGPVAVFAASRESHPYPNYLYAEAFIARFLVGHAATVGDGVVDAKLDMLDGSSLLAELLVDGDLEALKRDNARMYNLFGDPATRLRYPGPATIETPSATALARSTLDLTVRAEGASRGEVLVTLETERNRVRGALTSAADLAKLSDEEAFERMTENYARALDKVVERVELPIADGLARLTLRAPDEPGRYFVKVLVRSASGDVSMGHTALEVRPP